MIEICFFDRKYSDKNLLTLSPGQSLSSKQAKCDALEKQNVLNVS